MAAAPAAAVAFTISETLMRPLDERFFSPLVVAEPILPPNVFKRSSEVRALLPVLELATNATAVLMAVFAMDEERSWRSATLPTPAVPKAPIAPLTTSPAMTVMSDTLTPAAPSPASALCVQLPTALLTSSSEVTPASPRPPTAPDII